SGATPDSESMMRTGGNAVPCLVIDLSNVTSKPRIPDVLAARYASPELARLWSPEHKVIAERRLWLAVLRAQAELGVPVPQEAIDAYEKVLGQADLDSIAARERVTRPDVKGRQ